MSDSLHARCSVCFSRSVRRQPSLIPGGCEAVPQFVEVVLRTMATLRGVRAGTR